jgi:hypothetical protein
MNINWNRWEQIYLFPPEPLLPRIMNKLDTYKGHGVIILPHRPLEHWWPRITEGKKRLTIELRFFQSTLNGVTWRPSNAAPNFHAWSF